MSYTPSLEKTLKVKMYRMPTPSSDSEYKDESSESGFSTPHPTGASRLLIMRIE